MPGRLAERVLSWIDARLAALGHGFVQRWGMLERAYRRPLSWLAFRLGFAFYPLLALGAIVWLGWDWSHARSLDAAENEFGMDRLLREINDCRDQPLRAGLDELAAAVRRWCAGRLMDDVSLLAVERMA